MKRLKVKVCTGKCCRSEGSEELLDAVGKHPELVQADVKVKDSGCLGHCGKRKHGNPPFAEIDVEPLAEATEARILQAVRRVAKARD